MSIILLNDVIFLATLEAEDIEAKEDMVKSCCIRVCHDRSDKRK